MSVLSDSDYKHLRLHTSHSLVSLCQTLCDVQRSLIFYIEACKSDDIGYTKHHIKDIDALKTNVNNFQSYFECFLNDFGKCQ